MHTCLSCELPIKPEDMQSGCRPGVFYHKICFDLVATALAHDLTLAMRAMPEKYRELPNGNFVEVAPDDEE